MKTNQLKSSLFFAKRKLALLLLTCGVFFLSLSPISAQPYDLTINAGQDVVAAIAASSPGQRILIQGFYRITAPVVPKADQQITLNGTLDGSVIIPTSSWVSDGAGHWVASGQLPAAYTDGGKPEFTTGIYAYACQKREQLFINNIWIRRVMALSAVTANTFYADYAANKIYIGQTPTGKTIEVARAQYAIKSTAARVKIIGKWTVQKFATPSQSGAFQPEGTDWEIRGGIVQWVHAIGLRLVNSHNTIVQGVTMDHCGQLGFANTSSNNTQWLSCKARWNNTNGYQWDDWESGGGKITRSLNTVVSDCWLLFNHGVGIWADIDNKDTKFFRNRVEDNDSDGIRHEISYSAEIANNTVLRNGLRHRPDSGSEQFAGRDPGPFATGGINVNSSGGISGGKVWIHHNTVKDNRNGIFIQQRTRTNPAWLLKAVLVENNVICSNILINPATGARWVDQNGVPLSGISGIGALSQTAARNAEIYSTDVIFKNNKYASTEWIMRWTGTAWRSGTLAQTQALGQEVGSTQGACPASLPTPGTGLQGTYYDNVDLTGTQLNRVDATVNFNWGAGSPGTPIGVETFSARWTGQVAPAYTQTYTFYTNSDDGVRLWVNGAQLVNNWTIHNAIENSGTIALTAGQKYDIILEYFDNSGAAIVQLSWSSSSQPKQIIPQASLYPTSAAVLSSSTTMQSEMVTDFTLRSEAEIPETLSTIESVSAYPNPATDILNVTFTSESENAVSVELMNTMSQVINKKSYQAVKGSNTVTLNIKGVEPGLYLLNVIIGSQKTVKKIIISK